MVGHRISEKDDALRQLLENGSGYAIQYVQSKLSERKHLNCTWEQWAAYIQTLIDRGELKLDSEMKLILGENFGGEK